MFLAITFQNINGKINNYTSTITFIHSHVFPTGCREKERIFNN